MEKRAESNSDSLKIKARKRCGKMLLGGLDAHRRL